MTLLDGEYIEVFTVLSEDEYISSVCILSGVVSENKALCHVTSDGGSLMVHRSRESYATLRYPVSILDVDAEVLHSGAAIYPGTFSALFFMGCLTFSILLILMLQGRMSKICPFYALIVCAVLYECFALMRSAANKDLL